MKETNRNRANVAKRRARQRKLRNRRIALTVCLMLVVMVASIGGTVAWLTAKTDPVVNTFTYGDINIELFEHKYNPSNNQLDMNTKVTANDQNDNYKIIPGVDLPKDPTVEVKANSEKCWLFVKVDPSKAFVSGVTYTIDSGWTAGDGAGEGKNGVPVGVYYREVDAATAKAGTTFGILTDNKITVSDSLTKAQVQNQGTVTLKFTAYAVQKDGFANNPAGAWTQAQNAANS